MLRFGVHVVAKIERTRGNVYFQLSVLTSQMSVFKGSALNLPVDQSLKVAREIGLASMLVLGIKF